MAGLGTWMASRNQDGDGGKIIWSIMQLMSVLVALMGGFFLYLAFNTKTPPPVVESSGPSAPANPKTQTPTASQPASPTGPVNKPKVGTLWVTIVDAAGNPVDGARVTVTFFGKSPESKDSSSVGVAPVGGEPVGSGFQLVVESQLGTGRAAGTLTMVDQPLTIKLPRVPAPVAAQPSAEPPQTSPNPPSDQSGNTPPANVGTPPADGNN